MQSLPMESLQSGKQQNPAANRKKANGQNRTVRECALALLEFRDRTERELRRKLKEREYSTEEIDETVLFLKEYRYLDDEAYPHLCRTEKPPADPGRFRAQGSIP